MNKIYSMGNRIYIEYPYYEGDIMEEYIVAQVDVNFVCLVSLVNGNRLNNPIKVNDSAVITQKEMDSIIGEDTDVVTRQEYEEYLKETNE